MTEIAGLLQSDPVSRSAELSLRQLNELLTEVEADGRHGGSDGPLAKGLRQSMQSIAQLTSPF